MCRTQLRSARSIVPPTVPDYPSEGSGHLAGAVAEERLPLHPHAAVQPPNPCHSGPPSRDGLAEALRADLAESGPLTFVLETAARLRADLAAGWRNGLAREETLAANEVLVSTLEDAWTALADPQSPSIVYVHTIADSDARAATLSVAAVLAAAGRRAQLATFRRDPTPWDGADALVAVIDSECSPRVARERVCHLLAATGGTRPIIVCGDAGRVQLSDLPCVTRVGDLENLLAWATLRTTAVA